MALAPISKNVLASLAERAGLTLTQRQLDEMAAVYPRLEAMAERVRGGGKRSVAAEPAVIFQPGAKAP